MQRLKFACRFQHVYPLVGRGLQVAGCTRGVFTLSAPQETLDCTAWGFSSKWINRGDRLSFGRRKLGKLCLRNRDCACEQTQSEDDGIEEKPDPASPFDYFSSALSQKSPPAHPSQATVRTVSPATCSRVISAMYFCAPFRVASGVRRANKSSTRAIVPVHPVWWLAPSPAPLSPWKYS